MNTLEILYENDEIRIINKPYGLASQGGKEIKNSVDSILEEQIGQKCYLVHRLDKETSGLLITAKNPKCAAKWTNLISSKNVKKNYHAFVFGKMKNDSGVINQKIDEKGMKKNAISKYEVLNVFYDFKTKPRENDVSENTTGADAISENEKLFPISLIELTLETGRMHQIRKHLALQNCPIINDDKYGDFKKNKLFQKTTAKTTGHSIKKMFLMAKKLDFANKNLAEKSLPKQIEIQYSEHFKNLLEYFF